MQFLNANLPIVVTLSGRITFVIVALLLNASSLITCNVDGKTIFTTPVALMFSIIVIPSGMTISSASDNLF